MRSIGKTMRNSLPAIGLGLMSAVGMVGVSAIMAPAAVAQKPTEAFVNAYTAAKELTQKGQWAQALPAIDKAMGEAQGNAQKAPLAGMRVLAYTGLNNYSKIIESIEAHRALGGNAKEYDQQLLNAYDKTKQSAKAIEMGKKLIASGQADHRVYGFIASKALEAKNYAEALQYGQKAIDAAGAKPPKDYYNILLKANLDQKKMDAYYATLEKAAAIFNDPIYWKPLIEATRKQPKFKDSVYGVDLYRAFEQAKVQLSKEDRSMWGEFAMNRGVPLEAEKILAPLVASGDFGGPNDPKATRNKGFYATVQSNAKADKSGGLTKAEADAASKPTGATYITVGEGYMATGDYAKAIDAFQKGLTKGALEPGDADYAKLKLGIAQLKAGKKDDARKTWSDVKADNGSGWLARVYTNLSKV
jgi:tetratricopeptide (TPR) repeat protein